MNNGELSLEKLDRRIGFLESSLGLSYSSRREPDIPVGTDAIGAVQRIVCFVCKISMSNLIGKGKPKNISDIRKTAMALCVHFDLDSLTEIGKRFGDRDHGTVIHARNTAKDMLQTEPESEFSRRYEKCRSLIEKHFAPREPEYYI